MKSTVCFLTLTVILHSLSTCQASLHCDPNYFNVDQWCYRLYPPANFYDASSICRNSGAHLASIHDATINRYVANFGTETLIGLRYTNGGYEWSDGTILNFTRYDEGFFENREYYGDCTKNVNGVWKNAECYTDSIQFLCQKKAVPAATSNYQCPDPERIYRDFGELTSPGYPGVYDGSSVLQCRYQLVVKNDRNVEIDFSQAYLGLYDTLLIYEGWDVNNSRLRGIWPNANNETRFVTDNSNFMLLVFNGISNGMWQANWYSVPNPHESSPTPMTTTVHTTTHRPSTTTTTTTRRTTTTPTTTTTVARTTTTTSARPVIPCTKDIILLIDISNVASPTLFRKMKLFISEYLVQQWNVGAEGIEVGLFAYSQYTNQLTDFDLFNVAELVAVLDANVNQGSSQVPSIHRALKTAANINRERQQSVNAVTVLFAASSNADDVTEGIPTARNLTSNGNSLITVAFGEADPTVLGQLSSSPQFSFSTLDFSDSSHFADSINGLVCSNLPTGLPTTPRPSTTVTSHSNLPCEVDVAVLFDNSNEVSPAEYRQEISFIRDYLSPHWYINRDNVETIAIEYSYHYSATAGHFDYGSNSEFENALSSFTLGIGRAKPSIEMGLSALTDAIGNARPGVRKAAILFTYSSDYEDVKSAIRWATNLRIMQSVNLFIVALGNTVTLSYLKALSGSVLVEDLSSVELAQQINAQLCNDALPPSALPPAVTTLPTTTTLSVTTTAAIRTTQSSFCPDCTPPSASILVLLDGSDGLTPEQFERQRQFARNELTQKWNHYERMALGAYGDAKRFYPVAGYADLYKLEDWQVMVDVMQRFGRDPSLTNALTQARKQYMPDTNYGPQRVIIFASSRDSTDITAASAAAEALKAQGTVTVVATSQADSAALLPLTSGERYLINWPDLTDTSGLADKIFYSLN